MGPLGLGVGGLFAGLNAARAANQEQQMRQQQMAQQQNQFQQELSLRQQAQKDAQDASNRQIALEQLNHFQGIIEDPRHHTPDEVRKAQAIVDYISKNHPDLNFTPPQAQGQPVGAQQTAQAPPPGQGAAATPPRVPQTPAQAPMQFPPEQVFGNQVSQYQVNPSIGGSLPTPPQPTGHELGPQTPPGLFANPHPTQPGGAAPGVPAPPGSAGPQVAQPNAAAHQPQAPVDANEQALEGTVNYLRQQASRTDISDADRAAYYDQLEKAVEGRMAYRVQKAQLEGINAQNAQIGPNAESERLARGAEAALAGGQLQALPADTQAKVMTAIAELRRSEAELKAAEAKPGNNQLEVLKFQNELAQQERAFEVQLAQLGLDSSKFRYEQDKDAANFQAPGTEDVRKASIDALKAQYFTKDPVTGAAVIRDPAGFRKALSQLEGTSGAVSPGEMAPPGIRPDVWQAMTTQDPGTLLKRALATGDPEIIKQVKAAMASLHQMRPLFKDKFASVIGGGQAPQPTPAAPVAKKPKGKLPTRQDLTAPGGPGPLFSSYSP